jgi:hypothetical protein
VLVDKDRTTAVQATIELGLTTAKTAQAIALTGPALEATTGELLGGAAIGTDGAWTPKVEQTLSVRNGKVVVNVAPASALLLHAR